MEKEEKHLGEGVCLYESPTDANITNYENIISEATTFVDSLLGNDNLHTISVEQHHALINYIHKVASILYQTRNGQSDLISATDERIEAYNKYRQSYDKVMELEAKKHTEIDHVVNVLNNAIVQDSIGKGFHALQDKVTVLVGVIEQLTQSIHLVVQLLQALNGVNTYKSKENQVDDSFSFFTKQLKELSKLRTPITVDTINTTVFEGNVDSDRDLNIKG